MLAIHNYTLQFVTVRYAANAFAKLSKCQQFTTQSPILKRRQTLQTLLQSYQNVSNSQPLEFLYQQCIAANAFAKLSKCQQFTTQVPVSFVDDTLQTLLQSYQNVSNSQLTANANANTSGCKRFCKVIKMLAIHNPTTAVYAL